MRNYLWFKPTREEGRGANPAEIPQNPKEQQSLQTAAPTSPSERFPSYFCSQHPGDGRKREEKPQPETEFLDPTLWSECPTARSILVLPEPHSRIPWSCTLPSEPQQEPGWCSGGGRNARNSSRDQPSGQEGMRTVPQRGMRLRKSSWSCWWLGAHP